MLVVAPVYIGSHGFALVLFRGRGAEGYSEGVLELLASFARLGG